MNEVQANDTALELRLRRLWKDDIAAAHRGHIVDILSHVESEVTRLAHEESQRTSDKVRKHLDEHSKHETERLAKNDKRTDEHFAGVQKYLEDRVAEIVLKIFDEYGVLVRGGKPYKFEE